MKSPDEFDSHGVAHFVMHAASNRIARPAMRSMVEFAHLVLSESQNSSQPSSVPFYLEGRIVSQCPAWGVWWRVRPMEGFWNIFRIDSNCVLQSSSFFDLKASIVAFLHWQ